MNTKADELRAETDAAYRAALKAALDMLHELYHDHADNWPEHQVEHLHAVGHWIRDALEKPAHLGHLRKALLQIAGDAGEASAFTLHEAQQIALDALNSTHVSKEE